MIILLLFRYDVVIKRIVDCAQCRSIIIVLSVLNNNYAVTAGRTRVIYSIYIYIYIHEEILQTGFYILTNIVSTRVAGTYIYVL